MKLTAKTVKCKEIFVDGKSLGLFAERSNWNGYSDLRHVETGASLIVSCDEGISSIFGEIFDIKEQEIDVMKAAPSLLDQIFQARPKQVKVEP